MPYLKQVEKRRDETHGNEECLYGVDDLILYPAHEDTFCIQGWGKHLADSFGLGCLIYYFFVLIDEISDDLGMIVLETTGSRDCLDYLDYT